jgi:eukaryotic-like serine/threonine-protein kinase
MKTSDDTTGSGDDIPATVVERNVDLDLSVLGLDAIRDGSILGRYVVIERVGAGAMGIVLRAYDPKLHREVALKLVRPGAAGHGEFAEARLFREAQALARLNHPHVVSVYDVETTEFGVVIAMEYVEGLTLRSWRKEHARTWSEVVAVMLAAARGLAAAHAAELVHRDVKPDNILVGHHRSDQPHGPGRVRVTDFGLARTRSIFHPSNDRGLPVPDGSTEDDDSLTRAGTVMGTPGYMAPEQHAGAPADARADQYALCVALWEALYGERPFSGTDMDALAAAKQTGPPAPPKGSVPRWLHAVVARGLTVDPDHRWPSLDALAEALASGSTRSRRRSVWLGAAGLALGGLGWLGVHELQRMRSMQACEEAGAVIHHVAWSDEAQADLETGLLGTQLSFAATTHERARAWITPYVATWSRLRTQTCIEAEVQGDWDSQLYARAEQCFEERLHHLAAVVTVLSEGSRDSVPRAVAAVSELPQLETCTDPAALHRRPRLPDDPEVRKRADEIQRKLMRARGLAAAGRHEEALTLGRDVVRDASAQGLVSHELEAELATGFFADGAGHYDEAAERMRRALVEGGALGFDEIAADASLGLVHVVGLMLARHGEGTAFADMATILVRRLDGERDTPRHVKLLNNLANMHAEANRYDEAEPLHQRALAMAEAIYGPHHPSLSVSLNNLVNVHGSRGDHEAAERLAKRALEVSEGALGPDHPNVAWALTNVALTYDAREMYDEAESLFGRALTVREAALGPKHPYVAHSLTNLGVIADYRFEHENALVLFERALAIRREAFGSDHPEVARSLGNIAFVHSRRGEYDEAEAMFERVLAIEEAAYGPEHPIIARALTNIARMKSRKGAHAEAQVFLERALAIREEKLGPDKPIVAYTLDMLARARFAQDDHDAALQLHTRAVGINERASGIGRRDLAYSLESLASYHEDREELDEAEPLLRRVIEIRETLPGVGRHAVHALTALGRIELARDKPSRAVEHLERALAVDERLARYIAPELLAEARLLLARATWQLEGDRQRAIELATQARDEYRKAGAAGEEGLARAEQWLKRHS